MKDNSKELYNLFAKLLHAIIMADGIKADDEQKVLEKYLSQHPLYEELKSFLDNEQETASLVETYKEIWEWIKANGINEDFKLFLNVLEELLKVSDMNQQKYDILELVWNNLKQIEENPYSDT